MLGVCSEGFRCVSDASSHIWVTAAVPQGGRRGWKLGVRGAGGVEGETSTVVVLDQRFEQGSLSF